MKIAIIGFNTDGRSTYDYFTGLNQAPSSNTSSTEDERYELTICDRDANLEVPEGAQAVLGDEYLDNLDRFDLIIRTSGIHPRIILEKNPTVGHKISTQINEFFKASPTQNIIGVTGTKGKGTTSTLITQMLEASGKTVRLGGNIGIPPLSFIEELDAKSWVVLELSSFQLIDLQNSPHIAVCLMIAPEHLDWHANQEEYITAKEQLFARQGTADVAIYYHDNETSRRIADAGQGQKVPYYHSPGAEVVDGTIVIDGNAICRTDELKLLGQHNWQNVCAAVTAVWYAGLTQLQNPSGHTPDIETMREVLTTFSGLPFRIEYRGEKNGIKYYNDSFGTTPETTVVALQAFTEPKVIILGGSDKGASYDELAQAVKDNNVRKALLIGQQAGRIQVALEKIGFSDFQPGGDTMPDIVRNATAAAQSGDVVLLSTGCASFDMFKNYKDRGEQFNQAVSAL